MGSRTCHVGLSLSLLCASAVFEARADGAEARRPRRSTLPPTGGPRPKDKLPALASLPEAVLLALADTRELRLTGRHPERTALPVARPALSEYADDLSALGPSTAAFERKEEASASYCLRINATYETIHYGQNGTLRRAYSKAVHHGTGFAYQVKDGETYLATNEHVVTLPEVTDAEHPVEGVPAGSRRVSQSIRIVKSQDDDDRGSPIDLTLVASDAALDVAVLKTRHPLNVIPYRIGRSGSLKVGNVVVVRGYPLGVCPAVVVGRVTNPAQEDLEGAWDHVDFMTDAALNSGNSGSPVFAVSTTTHELELVGIFHAQYRRAHGMGVVVAIDGVRELLEAKRSPTSPGQAESDREWPIRFARTGQAAFFPFGGQVARALPDGEGARFEVYEDFPVTDALQIALVSRDTGALVELPGSHGTLPLSSLDDAVREPIETLERELWTSLGLSLRLSRARVGGDSSARARKELSTLRRRLTARQTEQKEMLSAVDAQRDALFQARREDGARRPASTRRGP